MAIRMAACNQIIGYLDDLLDPTAYDDYGPNGLQVPGSEQIQTLPPLDGHLEVGDNALLAQAIGAAEMEPFAAHRRAIVGVRARCHTRA